jgi:hypothetical protein
MNDEDAKHIKETILNHWRWIHELLAGEQAMLKMIVELKPHVSSEVLDVLLKYHDYKTKISQEMLLNLETTNPWLAAELDKQRPPISSDDSDLP